MLTFCLLKYTELILNGILATTPLIIVPSAVVIVSLPANPVPSFATAYTYAIFLFPVILSAYLISKSLTFAVVVVLSVSFVYFS